MPNANHKKNMNTHTHTQGKWHVGKRAADIAIYGGKGEEIAKILGFFNPDEENKANARLIASAPELLAHLEMLVFGIAEGVSIPKDGAAITAAREAIQKARGEA
jgi:hypothetical protein